MKDNERQYIERHDERYYLGVLFRIVHYGYRHSAPMTTSRWALLAAVFVIAFLIPELYSYFSGEPTFSQAVWLWSDLWWPFAIVASFSTGILFGHLFVPRKVFILISEDALNENEDVKTLKWREEASRAQKRRPF